MTESSNSTKYEYEYVIHPAGKLMDRSKLLEEKSTQGWEIKASFLTQLDGVSYIVTDIQRPKKA